MKLLTFCCFRRYICIGAVSLALSHQVSTVNAAYADTTNQDDIGSYGTFRTTPNELKELKEKHPDVDFKVHVYEVDTGIIKSKRLQVGISYAHWQTMWDRSESARQILYASYRSQTRLINDKTPKATADARSAVTQMSAYNEFVNNGVSLAVEVTVPKQLLEDALVVEGFNRSISGLSRSEIGDLRERIESTNGEHVKLPITLAMDPKEFDALKNEAEFTQRKLDSLKNNKSTSVYKFLAGIKDATLETRYAYFKPGFGRMRLAGAPHKASPDRSKRGAKPTQTPSTVKNKNGRRR